MNTQSTNTVLMVRPSEQFRKNEQTIQNNTFQEVGGENKLNSAVVAQKEFDQLVICLKNKGVHVVVLEDTVDVDTPDALFPNNWISFHENGDVVLYPMYAENRRLERREDVLDVLEANGHLIKHIIDYTEAESEAVFLEGTGSIVLDRVARKAYMSLSERSNEDLFIEFCEDLEYMPVIFNSYHKNQAIYHTNVMMSIATHFVIICTEAISDKKERKLVLSHLKDSGKEVVSISLAQMESYLGNVIELKDSQGRSVLLMSTGAYQSLSSGQKAKLEQHAQIIHSPLPYIERYGGGGARCMIAEVFLPTEKK